MFIVLLTLYIDAVLINSDDPSNTMESNVTVVTNSGVGIQVAEKDQRLCLLVMIPPKVDMTKFSQTILFQMLYWYDECIKYCKLTQLIITRSEFNIII